MFSSSYECRSDGQTFRVGEENEHSTRPKARGRVTVGVDESNVQHGCEQRQVSIVFSISRTSSEAFQLHFTCNNHVFNLCRLCMPAIPQARRYSDLS